VRIGCKGHLKAKLDRKGGYWYYDIVDLKHNHKLTPDKCMVHFIRSHKCLKDGIKNLMDVRTCARVAYAAQMNVMSDLHGGRDNWTFTIFNMMVTIVIILTCTCLFFNCKKALFMREERADDIPKLLEFFRSCKRANEYFYWDAVTP
jgi:hypothetical protein